MAAIKMVGFSLLLATATASVLQDAWPTHWPSIDLHAAFGALLLSMVMVHFRDANCGAGLSRTEARMLSRRLSRGVYLLLYLIFGAEQIVRVISNAAFSQPPEDLRSYLVYGFLALLAIRAMATLSVRRPPAPRMSPRAGRPEDAVVPR
jgi:hypothetical protein